MCHYCGGKVLQKSSGRCISGKVWFHTADQLPAVSDPRVQEIKCRLYELAQLKLYIIS